MTTNELLNHVSDTIQQMHGWCTPERAKMFTQLTLDHNFQNALCIGVYGGRSLIPVALAMQHKGSGIIHGVDPWSAEASAAGQDDETNRDWWGKLDHQMIFDSYIGKVNELKLNTHVRTYRLTNREAYEFLNNQTFDFLEIDGNHGVTDSCYDVDNYLPLLKPGGFLWMDDRFWAHTAYDKLKTMNVTEILTMDTGVLCQKRGPTA